MVHEALPKPFLHPEPCSGDHSSGCKVALQARRFHLHFLHKLVASFQNVTLVHLLSPHVSVRNLNHLPPAQHPEPTSATDDVCHVELEALSLAHVDDQYSFAFVFASPFVCPLCPATSSLSINQRSRMDLCKILGLLYHHLCRVLGYQEVVDVHTTHRFPGVELARFCDQIAADPEW